MVNNEHSSLSSNLLSSSNWLLQVFGALIMPERYKLWNVILSFLLVLALCIWPIVPLKIAVSTLILLIALDVERTLNHIFCLRKEEQKITWSQIVLLFIVGTWFVSVLLIIGIDQDSPYYLVVVAIGVVLGWIFQDTIKSVVAFFYLRSNDLLRIGDSIEVKSHDIDGMVKRISLTTVTVQNWDTTLSSLPIYILHSEHFKNSQKMLDGKTEGRQMMKTFLVDVGWIRPLTKEDIVTLYDIVSKLDEDERFILECLLKNEAAEGVLNIRLFRKFVYNILMCNQHISQQPRLVVRWLEQTCYGLPLHIEAFIMHTDLDIFEWYQSQIMEHIIEVLSWFDLRLYQRPSEFGIEKKGLSDVD